MKTIPIITLSLFFCHCGVSPKPTPTPEPHAATAPSASLASSFGTPKLTAKFSSKSERISPEPSSAPCPEDDEGACLVARLGEEQLGPLKQGLLAKEVLALLKAPEKKDAIQEEGATGLFVQGWEYPTQGISLGMSSDTRGGEQSINSLSISAPCAYTTKRGIGIGSTLAALKSAYQDAMSRDDLARTDATGAYLAGSVYGGLSFQLTDGKVSAIFLGAMAE